MGEYILTKPCKNVPVKVAIAISIVIGFVILIVLFFWGRAPRKINNEKNKANGNGNGSGNFARYMFARFSQNVPTHVLKSHVDFPMEQGCARVKALTEPRI